MAGAAGLTRLLEGAAFLIDPWHGYRDRLFHFHPQDLPTLLRADALAQLDPDASVRRLDDLWKLSLPARLRSCGWTSRRIFRTTY